MVRVWTYRFMPISPEPLIPFILKTLIT
jgi:hypothetical protein